MTYAHPEALVSTEWLADHLDHPDIRVVDGSWKMPGVAPTAQQDFAECHIPGATYFDIDAISDRANPLPHMLPSPEQFATQIGAMGLGSEHRIVVYDSGGWHCAWRAWWMLRVFGHDRVSILNGGLRKWRAEGRPVTTRIPAPAPARFAPRLRPELVRGKSAVRTASETLREQIVDARAQGRFEGTAPEPRPGLRSGHIPGSRSLPYDRLFDPVSKTVLPREQLEHRFREAGLTPDRPIVCSCGSGVTACALVFGLYLAGWPDAAVYDGSWSEWGQPGDTPIETGPAR